MASRLKPGRGLTSIDAMVESLRDYTFQAEELARLAERQRSRMLLVGYLLFSYLFFVATISIYVWSRIDTHDAALRIALGGFAALTFAGLPLLILNAFNRYSQYKRELQRTISRLSDTIRIISQVRDHVEGDKLEATVLDLRLREADAVLEHAERVLHGRLRDA